MAAIGGAVDVFDREYRQPEPIQRRGTHPAAAARYAAAVVAAGTAALAVASAIVVGRLTTRVRAAGRVVAVGWLLVVACLWDGSAWRFVDGWQRSSPRLAETCRHALRATATVVVWLLTMPLRIGLWVGWTVVAWRPRPRPAGVAIVALVLAGLLAGTAPGPAW